MDPKPHSIEHFGEQRDFWWHPDFLELMARRWRLHEASSLADIGCGLCHWSRLLYAHLKPPARLVGVDREARWVAEAPEHFRRAHPKVAPELLDFVQGDAAQLPLPDCSFDVVTSQTVLMHLPCPLDALRQMVRILRPGGLLICVEPNNLFNYVAFNSDTSEESVEVIVRRFEFWLRYHRGKIAAGQGNHTLGDLVPGYLAQLGLREIQVYQSDRTAPLFPPYQAREQKVLIAQQREWQKSELGPWNKEEVRRQVRLGGGSEEFFNLAFAEWEQKGRRELDGIEAGTFHGAGGGIHYLVSGRKENS